MADQTPTQVAESSTAAQPPVQPVEVPTDPTAYAEWRQTGKLPEAKPEAKPESKPKTEDSASSKESAVADAGTAKQEPKPKPQHGAKERLDEILADLKQAGLSPSELKTFRKQAQAAAEPPPAKAPEKTDKPATELKAPTRPKLADFDDYDKYEEALDKYHEDQSDYRIAKALEADRTARAQESQQREIAQRMDAAADKYGDGAKEAIISAVQTIMGDEKIPPVVRDLLGGSKLLTDVLYVLGSQESELAEFVQLAHSDPGEAIRKIVVLEGLVKAELGKGKTTRGEDGKFAAADEKPEKKAPEKKPDAPPPPTELSSRGSAPVDEVEGAIKAGDFRAYQAAKNRRDIARIRGN